MIGLLSWFKKKVSPPPPPPPMAVEPGADYIMDVGNPFQPNPTVRVHDVRDGWVRYKFTGDLSGGAFQHTPIKYFRTCYKRHEPQSGSVK